MRLRSKSRSRSRARLRSESSSNETPIESFLLEASQTSGEATKQTSLFDLDDLMDELEYSGKHKHVAKKVKTLLQDFAWNGSDVQVRGKTRHLLRECLQHKYFRAATHLLRHGDVATVEASQALLLLCQTPTTFADQKLALVQVLLEHKANADFTDAQGRNALLLASENHASDDFWLALIPATAQIDQRNAAGDTALHLALQLNQDDEVVRALLAHGANPNLLDGKGRLALVTAAHRPSGTGLQLLLRHGANVDLPDKDGQTALSLVENPAAAMLLLRKGARSDIASSDDGVTPLHTAFDLWCRWRRGENLAVLLFHQDKQRSLCNLLVQQAQGRVNLRDAHGRTCLHYACQVQHTPAPEFVAALVQLGADRNARDRNGWTPLHVAVACGNYVTATQLLSLGAEVAPRDDAGRTPCHVIGLNSQAASRLPTVPLAHAIRVIAFGPDAPPAPRVIPHHHPSEEGDEDGGGGGDDDDLDSTHHEEDDHEAPLIQEFLHRGFNFRSLDDRGNNCFSYATDDTLHYMMVHAAACQGLFCSLRRDLPERICV